MAHQVKLQPVMSAFHLGAVWTPNSPISIEHTANDSETAAEDGPKIWVPDHMEEPGEDHGPWLWPRSDLIITALGD